MTTPPRAERRAAPPGLGPHCVGQRVVVRRTVPGETGPTGGPAFTDVLGTMLVWEDGTTVVERADGTRVTIAVADIVSGKPVPPRPAVRLRVGAEEAERRAVAGWPPLESERLGDWLLRAAGGFSSRANSVLAVGSPDRPVDEALDAVREFYAARGLPAWAQVVVGSDAEAALTAHGWVPARPGEADTEFQLASVAGLARALRRHPDADPALRTPDNPPTRLPAPELTPHATETWLASDARARRERAAAVAVLEGPDDVAFLTIGDPAVAKGRVSVADDWAGITDVWVSPEHRRRGLSLEVLRGLVGWAAERGATTIYLQVRGDNPAALALYERLGFTTHHTYRYLAAPGTPRPEHATDRRPPG